MTSLVSDLLWAARTCVKFGAHKPKGIGKMVASSTSSTMSERRFRTVSNEKLGGGAGNKARKMTHLWDP